MTLIAKIRAILTMSVSDTLAEELITALVSSATGKRGGRRRTDPALDERKQPLPTPTNASPAQIDTPLYPPDLVSGSSLSGSPDPPEASSQKVVRKSGPSQEFLDWYALYPKKRSRRDAWRAWQQVTADLPNFTQLRLALDWQRVCAEWTKDGGAFIPYPATYLRGHRWADEPAKPPPTPASKPTSDYCAWHLDWKHEKTRAFKPDPSCATCRHLLAQARTTSGEPMSLSEIIGGTP